LVGVAVGLEQHARRDLPREAPAVLAPAAGAFLAAIPGDRVPVAVGFLLVLGHSHEADGLVRLEVRAAVEADEIAAEDGEVDRELVILLPTREIRRRGHGRADAAVGEDRGVEFGRLARLAFVQTQAGCQFVRHVLLLVDAYLRGPTRPNDAPCGSSPLSANSPPGISCGPLSTLPPPSVIAAMARSMSSTPM